MTEHELMARAVAKHRAREHRFSFYVGCVVGGLLMLFATSALAVEATMPIRAGIVQCGAGQDEIKAMCAKDARCCVFVK